MSTWI